MVVAVETRRHQPLEREILHDSPLEPSGPVLDQLPLGLARLLRRFLVLVRPLAFSALVISDSNLIASQVRVPSPNPRGNQGTSRRDRFGSGVFSIVV